LIGGLAVPGHGFGIILLYSPTILVKPANIIPPYHVAMVGCLAEPEHCVWIVLVRQILVAELTLCSRSGRLRQGNVLRGCNGHHRHAHDQEAECPIHDSLPRNVPCETLFVHTPEPLSNSTAGASHSHSALPEGSPPPPRRGLRVQRSATA